MTLSNVTYEKLFEDFLVSVSQVVKKARKKDVTFEDMLVTIKTDEISIKTDETPTFLLDG